MGMKVTGVTGGWPLSSTSPKGADETQGSLGDQFMAILLTQLRYQDPMEPMKEKDFFAQMAQFTTASETQSMNKNLTSIMSSMGSFFRSQSFLLAGNLIGKSFVAQVEGKKVEGTIESCAISNGKIVISSSGKEIPLECLTSIGGSPSGVTNA